MAHEQSGSQMYHDVGSGKSKGGHLLLGDGRGGFTGRWNTGSTIDGVPKDFRYVSKLAVGDLNNDGNVDVVFIKETADYYFNTWRRACMLGNGDGSFQPIVNIPPDTFAEFPGEISRRNIRASTAYALVLGDINNDGLLDVIIGRVGFQSYIGHGNGTFAAPVAHYHRERDLSVCADCRPQEMAMGDMDGDGNLDLITGVSAHGNGATELHMGDGNAGFTFKSHFWGAKNAVSIRIADYNRDGHLDIAIGISTWANQLMTGTGGGEFIASHLGAGIARTYALAFGDVNNDECKQSAAPAHPKTLPFTAVPRSDAFVEFALVWCSVGHRRRERIQ